MVAYLIGIKANINRKNAHGYTPLMWCADANKNEASTMSLLLECKADTSIADGEGNTSLMWAATEGKTDLVELLLEANCLLDVKNQVQFFRDSPMSLSVDARSALFSQYGRTAFENCGWDLLGDVQSARKTHQLQQAETREKEASKSKILKKKRGALPTPSPNRSPATASSLSSLPPPPLPSPASSSLLHMSASSSPLSAQASSVSTAASSTTTKSADTGELLKKVNRKFILKRQPSSTASPSHSPGTSSSLSSNSPTSSLHPSLALRRKDSLSTTQTPPQLATSSRLQSPSSSPSKRKKFKEKDTKHNDLEDSSSDPNFQFGAIALQMSSDELQQEEELFARQSDVARCTSLLLNAMLMQACRNKDLNRVDYVFGLRKQGLNDSFYVPAFRFPSGPLHSAYCFCVCSLLRP